MWRPWCVCRHFVAAYDAVAAAEGSDTVISTNWTHCFFHFNQNWIDFEREELRSPKTENDIKIEVRERFEFEHKRLKKLCFSITWSNFLRSLKFDRRWMRPYSSCTQTAGCVSPVDHIASANSHLITHGKTISVCCSALPIIPNVPPNVSISSYTLRNGSLPFARERSREWLTQHACTQASFTYSALDCGSCGDNSSAAPISIFGEQWIANSPCSESFQLHYCMAPISARVANVRFAEIPSQCPLIYRRVFSNATSN